MAPGLSLDVLIRHPEGPEVHAALEAAPGVTVLFGPSGSGKTTLLRAVAGLIRPQAGWIRFGARTWFDHGDGTWVSPQARRLGVLFQDYALFPHLTVEENIGFALHGKERAPRTQELMEMLSLGGLARRRPGEVSGGERQRVALGRALAARPAMLLLDEPLSAVDLAERQRLRRELGRWLGESGLPALLVTHDRTEALQLGDRLAVMSRGRLRQCGPMEEVFSRPADPDIASILGAEAVLPGCILARGDGLASVDVGGGILLAPDPGGTRVFLVIRAEDVLLEPASQQPSTARNRFDAVVARILPEGPFYRIHLDAGFHLESLVTRPALAELALEPGSRVRASIKATAIHAIPHD